MKINTNYEIFIDLSVSKKKLFQESIQRMVG